MVTDQQVQLLLQHLQLGGTLREAAARAGMSAQTARTYRNRRREAVEHFTHTWRIQPDPFGDVWEDVLAILQTVPNVPATALLAELQRRYPDTFGESHLQTLVRQVDAWRIQTAIPRYGPRATRPTKLDPYLPYLEERMRAGLSNAAVLLRELKERGYTGGYSAVRDVLHPLRQVNARGALAEPAKESFWMLRLLQGDMSTAQLQEQLDGTLAAHDVACLLRCVLERPLRYRNRAITALAHSMGISCRTIASFLLLEPKTVSDYIRTNHEQGIAGLLALNRKGPKKVEDPTYKDAVFSVLHAPPSAYNINRTTWRMEDLHRTLTAQGVTISRDGIRRIIRDAGYRFRKARTVLTSTDPNYREKLQAITAILSNLGANERFFSVDEFGPFAVKIQGGISLVPHGQMRIVPQWQESKGSLIVTAALELGTNQVTHFYSDAKNTAEMSKLLHLLLDQYAEQDCIYFSWDAASWHASTRLYEEVERLNSTEHRSAHRGPIVKLAPLPACAQFLNVIESVFSGMSRAIIQNSDYADVPAAKAAIDRHFAERNAYFHEHPKRAGNKIWGAERVEATFKESNNCKDPRWEHGRAGLRRGLQGGTRAEKTGRKKPEYSY